MVKRNYGNWFKNLIFVAIAMIILLVILWVANMLFGWVTDFTDWLNATLIDWWMDPATEIFEEIYNYSNDIVHGLARDRIPVGFDGRTENVTIAEGLVTGTLYQMGNLITSVFSLLYNLGSGLGG